MPLGATAPTGAVVLDCGDDFACLLGSSKGHKDLVEDDVIEDGKSGVSEELRKKARLVAIALDEFAQPGTAERTHGGPQFD